jgi:hypothetical protein
MIDLVGGGGGGGGGKPLPPTPIRNLDPNMAETRPLNPRDNQAPQPTIKKSLLEG